MANNTTQELRSTVHPLSVSISGYTEKLRFAASPLNYDVILGKKWTTEHRAIVNCYTNEIVFQHKGRRHTIVAREPSKPNFVSVNSITEDHDRKLPFIRNNAA